MMKYPTALAACMSLSMGPSHAVYWEQAWSDDFDNPPGLHPLSV